MSIVISVSNVKGGVAKTTTAATLAAGLNCRGYTVLMIDSDPQTNLTMCFMREPAEGTATLHDIYADGASVDDVKRTIRLGLDLIVGDFELCSADMEFLGRVGSLKILSRAVRDTSTEYDFVIIDTPPNLGCLSLNAFTASDYIVTPMAADSFSLKAIRLLKSTLDDVSEDLGKNIPVIGVLLTKYSGRTNVAKSMEENIAKAADLLDTRIFESRIRQAVVVQESQLTKIDLFEYAPKAPVVQDYNKFIDELLERIDHERQIND